jgi:very-short-patch-repair endonuclease
MNNQTNNNPELKEFRKSLRKNLTPAEAALWRLLKGEQMDGRKFRRQFSVGYYILDFYCHSEKLALELDGAHHFTEEGRAYDEKRDAYLNKQGILVIRIEKKVFENTGQVLDFIKSNFSRV